MHLARARTEDVQLLIRSSDRRTLASLQLREGPKFHNGKPVRAQDCLQSLKRWRDGRPLGSVRDDRTMRITFSRSVPIFLEAIARGSASFPFMVPEHIARTDPYKQITDPTGSGHYKFNVSEFATGSFASYSKFMDYVPRPEKADFTSGRKDRIFR
jgi:peptide/nickel transport system substrate-binding protein